MAIEERWQLCVEHVLSIGIPSSAAFPQNVAVGQTVDISVNMTAPSTAGPYRGFWMFKNANGALFGIGSQANKPWWVDIRVSGTAVTVSPTPTGSTPTPGAGVAYDFAAKACDGTWYSGAGQLPFAGEKLLVDARFRHSAMNGHRHTGHAIAEEIFWIIGILRQQQSLSVGVCYHEYTD